MTVVSELWSPPMVEEQAIMRLKDKPRFLWYKRNYTLDSLLKDGFVNPDCTQVLPWNYSVHDFFVEFQHSHIVRNQLKLMWYE